MDVDEEAYILLLLADGNLPTGSFVASSGLESYITHGFFARSSTKAPLQSVCEFVEDSLGTYARTASPFVTDAHQIVSSMTCGTMTTEDALPQLITLDDLYDAMTLNHVARRASQGQGVALLTLYSKGFSAPADSYSVGPPPLNASAEKMGKIVDKMKFTIRKGDTPGHLPICWGILTAALGLGVERSLRLHLFLHARGLLSAAVRLNAIGPYAAQQLLLHTIKPLVQQETQRCTDLRTGVMEIQSGTQPSPSDRASVTVDGPATTWPLGEILATRHDLQHSRVFNS
ncbi:hypothetical protein PUNSTDRAFT_63702 [Punctularia strigosozonata HHB-11173 SS5]|uniref:uncharacterized protein n=1 Tax=Punctularia strigosozonata (strain HHB-11173) TaxID=741275 RepID=UPI0004416F91|nr:uncharacterized protein PUNSTDRAFT_63702 [Punctularia strigosozonata HHB-11173 SS5]EIN10504.1 hypothetical protein PUNSTDRAFT_63702 [Punctularia strigosozonata HHB-11173 SS5]